MTMRSTERLVQDRIAEMRRQKGPDLPQWRRESPGRWERSRDRLGAGLVRLGQRLQANSRPQVGGKALPLGH